MARRQLTIDNAIATELAGSEDAVLRALEGHLGCDVFLRGNVLTLDGEVGDVRTAETVVGELVELIEHGHEIAPGDDRGRHRRPRQGREPGRDPR